MSGDLCLCGCGELAKIRGCAPRCYRRWHHDGFPEGGPRPALSAAESGRRSGRARAPEPDLYDVQWLAGEPERRALRAKRVAGDLVRCVGADDAEGVRLLLHRVTDWHALAVVLAECADPRRAAVVCGTPRAPLAAVLVSASPADQRPSELAEAGSVDRRAAEGDADEAA